MKNKFILGAILIFGILLGVQQTVYANSSWNWLTETQPYELLPIAMAFTLIIEIIALVYVLRISIVKSIKIILIGNMCSFLVPYIINYMMLNMQMGYDSLYHAFATGPYYIIGIGYLIMTLIIEFPIVWIGIQQQLDDKKRGVAVIVTSNTITTLLVMGFERIVCYGKW